MHDVAPFIEAVLLRRQWRRKNEHRTRKCAWKTRNGKRPTIKTIKHNAIQRLAPPHENMDEANARAERSVYM